MKPLSTIVQSCGRTVLPFALVFGMYIIMHGHLTPGGGFQGGAVLASAIAILIVSFGHEAVMHAAKKDTFTLLEGGGLIAFISLVFLGIGTSAFYNFLANGGPIFGQAVAFGANGGSLNTGGILPLCNIFVGTEVLAGISIVLLMMALGSSEAKG